MGMVVLDGSENWVYNYSYFGIYTDFYYNMEHLKNSHNYLCDRFKSGVDFNNGAQEGLVTTTYNLKNLAIRILNSKLSTTDVPGFKQWLSENPTTVVYELKEPWYEPIGEYGKVVLDGSEDEGWTFNHSSSTFHTYYVRLSNFNSTLNPNIVSDRFSYIGGADTIFNNTQGFKTQPSYSNVLYLCLNNITSVEAVKQYLQQNPVTVIHQLERPQPINEDMRFNIASTSTIEYQSSVPMANTQFLPYRNELPLLESSTQYRVTFDCDVEGLELMVSLGGTSQTITSGLHNELSFITPSLQTDGKLTIDGYGIAKIDNVLVTKGDMEYEYFEGLKSGFEDGYIPQSIIDLTNVTISDGAAINLPVTNIKPNTKYTIIDETLKGKYMAIRFRDNNKDTSTDSSILSDTILDYIPFSGLYVITTYNETYDFSNVVLRMYNNFGMNNTTIDFSNMIILEGDWTDNPPTYEEVMANPNKYKATIKIQNPNAPIFGKGGRL